MKKKKSLISSLIAIVICFSMLLGTTYAWFTDSIVNTNNIIKSGNVEVELWHKSNANEEFEEVKEGTKLFVNTENKPILWEPGASATETFEVKNVGSLAFKYEFRIKAIEKTFNAKSGSLEDVLKITIDEEEKSFDTVISGTITKGADPISHKVTIVWEQGANDNDYMDLDMWLGVELVATQLASEYDGTGNQYDVNANVPSAFNSATRPTTATEEMTVKAAGNNAVEASLPANLINALPQEVKAVSIAHTEPILDETKNTVTFEAIDLLDQDGNVIDLEKLGADEEVTVTLSVPDFLEGKSVDVKHDGEVVAIAVPVVDGKISYTTKHFSEVVVSQSFKAGSIYIGIDPRELDLTLENDAERKVFEYMQGGQNCYLIADQKTVYAADPVSSSGKLYSIISGLKNNEHSTVYLLPGTYNEATTINVYSSMDIIGLGDKGAVKVVKVSSSDSNRHLFNANGTKEDYIEVSIQNMTLDATANTINGKDNAAVQCIRKTKVKCYNLDIIKGSDISAVAFYLNGNNAVDGVKYPAYLYAENCTLNTTRTFGIVTTAGTYKFYHNNLTYNNGDSYTNNSGSIKNISMTDNDWDWDN